MAYDKIEGSLTTLLNRAANPIGAAIIFALAGYIIGSLIGVAVGPVSLGLLLLGYGAAIAPLNGSRRCSTERSSRQWWMRRLTILACLASTYGLSYIASDDSLVAFVILTGIAALLPAVLGYLVLLAELVRLGYCFYRLVSCKLTR